MTGAYPETHKAVATIAKRAPLELIQVPTIHPGPGEVVVRVQWTSSSPVDLHQADGGFFVSHPFILGCSYAGTVVATGPEDPALEKPNAAPLVVGDRVFGFAAPNQKSQGFQTYITLSRHLLGRVPENMTIEAAVTAPTNLVTAVYVCINDLGLDLPWPKPEGWKPSHLDEPILIWGAASSVGLFTVQVLAHWGYKNIIAVASSKHHAEFRSFSAVSCFDYKDTDVTEQILARASQIPFIVDCIGQVEGTVLPITRIAKKGSTVAIMIPVIVRDATADLEPILSTDPSEFHKDLWAEGVKVIGTRTFFYDQIVR